MKKIIIIGSPGSGKSTFAKELASKLNIELYHLDIIRCKYGNTMIDLLEFEAKLEEILSKDSWIIDGNYQRTMEKRIMYADTIFFFDIPVNICLEGIKERIGKKSDDNPFIEDKLDDEFYEYVKSFSTIYTPMIYELIEKYKDTKEIIIFKNREDKYKYL